MKRLLYYLDMTRGRPGMQYLFRFMLRDAIEDVLIGAECSAACYGLDIEGEIGIAKTFRECRIRENR